MEDQREGKVKEGEKSEGRKKNLPSSASPPMVPWRKLGGRVEEKSCVGNIAWDDEFYLQVKHFCDCYSWREYM